MDQEQSSLVLDASASTTYDTRFGGLYLVWLTSHTVNRLDWIVCNIGYFNATIEASLSSEKAAFSANSSATSPSKQEAHIEGKKTINNNVGVEVGFFANYPPAALRPLQRALGHSIRKLTKSATAVGGGETAESSSTGASISAVALQRAFSSATSPPLGVTPAVVGPMDIFAMPMTVFVELQKMFRTGNLPMSCVDLITHVQELQSHFVLEKKNGVYPNRLMCDTSSDYTVTFWDVKNATTAEDTTQLQEMEVLCEADGFYLNVTPSALASMNKVDAMMLEQRHHAALNPFVSITRVSTMDTNLIRLSEKEKEVEYLQKKLAEKKKSFEAEKKQLLLDLQKRSDAVAAAKLDGIRSETSKQKALEAAAVELASKDTRIAKLELDAAKRGAFGGTQPTIAHDIPAATPPATQVGTTRERSSSAGQATNNHTPSAQPATSPTPPAPHSAVAPRIQYSSSFVDPVPATQPQQFAQSQPASAPARSVPLAAASGYPTSQPTTQNNRSAPPVAQSQTVLPTQQQVQPAATFSTPPSSVQQQQPAPQPVQAASLPAPQPVPQMQQPVPHVPQQLQQQQPVGQPAVPQVQPPPQQQQNSFATPPVSTMQQPAPPVQPAPQPVVTAPPPQPSTPAIAPPRPQDGSVGLPAHQPPVMTAYAGGVSVAPPPIKPKPVIVPPPPQDGSVGLPAHQPPVMTSYGPATPTQAAAPAMPPPQPQLNQPPLPPQPQMPVQPAAPQQQSVPPLATQQLQPPAATSGKPQPQIPSLATYPVPPSVVVAPAPAPAPAAGAPQPQLQQPPPTVMAPQVHQPPQHQQQDTKAASMLIDY